MKTPRPIPTAYRMITQKLRRLRDGAGSSVTSSHYRRRLHLKIALDLSGLAYHVNN